MSKKTDSLASRFRKWLGINFDTLFALRDKTHIWLHQQMIEALDLLKAPKSPKQFPTYRPFAEPLETRQMLTTTTWTGGGSDTNWTTSANWSSGVPGMSDTAVISSGTVTLNTAVQIANLSFSGGTLTGANTLKVTGTSSSWAGGIISSYATLEVDNGAALSVTGAALISYGSLQNYGTVTWDADFFAIPVTGSIDNEGTFVVAGTSSLGQYAIGANFTQGTGGTLAVEIEQYSGSYYDQVQIQGTASLDGTLEVRPFSGLNVSVGDTFPVLTASSVSGTFANLNVAGFTNALSTTYSGTAANVVIGSAATLSTGTTPAQPQSVGDAASVSLFTGNLNVQVAAAQDDSPLDQDTLYYYPGLEYNSDTADPTPLIGVSVPTLSTDPSLTDIKATLTWNGSSQTPVTFSMPAGSTPGDTYDLALQVASPVASTGLYSYTVAIEEDYSSSSTIQTLTGTKFVVVNGNTPYGNGWSLTDENHLYFDGNGNAYLVHGNGGYTTFTATTDAITAASWSSGIATITAANGFTAGQTVLIAGVTSGGSGSFDGTFTIASATSTSFTYFLGTNPGTASAFGVVAYAFTFQSSSASYGGLSYESGTLVPFFGSYIFTAADNLQWDYNSAGLLTSVADPVGINVIYSYDGSNRLTSVVDPDNNEVQFNYTGSLLSSIEQGYLSGTFHPTATTSLSYDGSDNLTAVVDPESNTRTFGYNADSKLTSDSDGSAAYAYTDGALTSVNQGSGLYTASFAPQLLQELGTTAVISSDSAATMTSGTGGTTLFQYDAAGRLTSETLPSGGSRSTTYNSANLPATTTDLNGNTTRYNYITGTQEVSSMVTPDGLTSYYAYGTNSDQPTQVIDGYGKTSTFDYDIYGDLTETINPDGSTTRATFSAGLMQTSVDALGKTTLYDYDGNRRLTASIDPLGHTTLFSYNLATGVITTVSPTGATSVGNYNASGEMASQVDGDGGTISSFYDANGNVTASVDALGHTSYQDYDSAGRLTASVNADGATMREYYDTANEVTATVDALGKTSYQQYDASGNVTETIDADGRTTQQKYDAAGNVTATIDALGHTSLQDYSSAGLLTAAIDADGRTTLYDYDSQQRLTATIDPNGHTTRQIYDANGNITATVDADGHSSFQYYDAADRVTAAVNADGKTSFTLYDASGEVTATVDANGHTSLTYYDANGNVTASVDADGHTTFTDYNAAGQATATVDALGKTSFTDFDANGNITASVDANGHTSFTFYDAAGQATASVDGDGHTTLTDYDAAGQVTATVDALGKTSFTDYDANGNGTASVDANGHTSFTDYDAAGQVTATVDALGRTAFTDFDAAGRVTAAIDAGGHTLLTFFDAAGQATQSVDADGHTTFTDFDAGGQVTATVNALGKTSLTDYDANGNVTASVDANGHTSFTDYDAAGRVTAMVDALGKTSFTDFDANGNVTASVNADGNTSFTLYDANGQVTAAIDALGKTSFTDYDANGNVTASIDANGKTSFTRYDADGQVTAAVDADGYTSLTMYDAAGNVTETVDADAYTTHNYFDADNRLTESINNAGQTETNSYDAAGNLTKTIDFNGFTTRQIYDADNQVTASVNAVGATAYSFYDSVGQVTESIDSDGNTTRQFFDNDGMVTATVDGRGYTSFQEYNANGNVTASIDQDGDTTQFKFDADGNQTAVIDPDLNTTLMAYDADGRLTQTISPTAGTSVQIYDADGNVIESFAADTSEIVTWYDVDGRVTAQTWWDPLAALVNTEAKSYDNNGDLLTASNDNGTYGFSYDNDGRVTQVSEPFGQTLSYAYDGDGNQTQVIDSFGGTQTSIYDVQDRLVTREYTGESQNLRVDFTYNADNQIASQTDYSNLAGTALVSTTDNEYDANGNVTSIQSYDASSTLIEGFTYTYDAAGNLNSEIDTQSGTPTTTTYSYDHAGQLLSGGASSYSYDANGNRNSTGYTTGAGNEMTSDGTYNYTYDAKGNELTKTNIATGDEWTYGYNNANELTSAVETTSGSVIEKSVSFEYDLFGNLLEEGVTVGMTTTTTRYAYDGWNPAKTGATGTSNFDAWAVFNSLGSLTSRQLQGDGIDQHLAYVESSNAYWYLTDHLGSTRAVINNSGTMQDSLVYDAYGNITYQTPSPSTTPLYSYTGRELDVETGLQYNRARWYDSTTGRWISQDPLGFDAGDSNLYRYVNNGPTIANDPSGLELGLIIPPVGVYGILENIALAQIPLTAKNVFQDIKNKVARTKSDQAIQAWFRAAATLRTAPFTPEEIYVAIVAQAEIGGNKQSGTYLVLEKMVEQMMASKGPDTVPLLGAVGAIGVSATVPGVPVAIGSVGGAMQQLQMEADSAISKLGNTNFETRLRATTMLKRLVALPGAATALEASLSKAAKSPVLEVQRRAEYILQFARELRLQRARPAFVAVENAGQIVDKATTVTIIMKDVRANTPPIFPFELAELARSLLP